MLEIINSGSTEISPHDKRDTLFLNCWENSSPLIQELERTVNFAERKCGDLMQKLHFYKEYYKKWIHMDHLQNVCNKKKMKKYCRRNCEEENYLEKDQQKVNECFSQKIKNKIFEANNKIKEANRKLSNKSDSSPSYIKETWTEKPVLEEVSTKQIFVDNKICKSEPLMNVSEKDDRPDCPNIPSEKDIFRISEKSIRLRNKKEAGQLLRKNCSLQKYKIRSKSLPQGVRRKFGFGGFFEVFDPNESSKMSTSKTESCKSLKNKKNGGKSKTELRKRSSSNSLASKRSSRKSFRGLHRKLSKSKTNMRVNGENGGIQVSKNLIVKSEHSEKRNAAVMSKYLNCDYKPNNFCNAILPSYNGQILGSFWKLQGPFPQGFSRAITKPRSSISFLRQPIPFIPCSSTSKTFNLGLNIQQVLSLIKQKRPSVSLQDIVEKDVQAAHLTSDKLEPAVNTFFLSRSTASHSRVTSLICPAREGSEDCLSLLSETVGSRSKCTVLKKVQSTRSRLSEEANAVENTTCETEPKLNNFESIKLERPEDVWVVEQPDPSLRKVRMRCTCFPSKQCVDYHKVLRQYTGWKLPTNKTESFASESRNYNPVITCSKSKLYSIPSIENLYSNSRENSGRIELIKVHNDLINLNRKYSYLQEQISQNNYVDNETNAELEAMESELAIKEVEFKDMLNFYSQLMLLKEKMKTLRLRSEQSHSTFHQLDCQRPSKKDPLRPTPSMTLTKVLRKIQGLQEKIKLIDTP